MIRSENERKGLVILLAFVTLTSSITAGVAFVAGPTAAHGDHQDGGGTDGSNDWATDSESFRKETVMSGLSEPTETVFLPDGRMLVIQKGGEILINDPDTNGGSETYLDLNQIDSIESERERGLLGIALANDFQQSGEFYLYYSRLDNPDAAEKQNAEPENVLAKFTHRENDGGTTSRADPASREVLWRNEIRAGSSIVCCHLGGGLDVGPDGKIYITTGDEFQGERAQDLSVPDGKVIRLNADGSIPQDNPYADDGDPETLGEIWASGLRNPYRAKFADNGELYIGEVGGNVEPSSQEDIHLGRKGANYGWPNCEGMCDNPDYDDPIYTYSHGESGGREGAAVTVGPLYNGDMYPAEYDDVLFYSDYNDGWVKYLTTTDGGTEVEQSYNFDQRAGAIVSMTVGPDGALYGTNYIDQTGQGSVIRYVYEDENKAPSVDSTSVTPKTGEAPLDVTFEAAASDPEGDELTYTWHFGDGTTAQGSTATHTYEQSGSYDAYVEVSDGNSAVESDTTTVTAGTAPEITIESPTEGSTFRAGERIDVSATVTDAEDGQLSGDSIEWNVYLDHNAHTHPDVTRTGDSFTFDAPTTGHPTTGDVGYEFTVTATDSDGLQTRETVEIRPEEVDITLNSQPEGIAVNLEGQPRQTTNGGYTFDTVIGYEHSVSASQSVCRDGTRYEFTGWSDDRTDRTRTYVVPDADATLTAQYETAGSCDVVAQYEADTGVQTDADGVTTWADTSGNGNDLTARGAPQFDADAGNGSGAIVLDGQDDALAIDGATGLPQGDSDRTMFVVANYRSEGFGGAAYGSAAQNRAFGLAVDNDGKLAVQGWGGNYDQVSSKQGTGAGWVVQNVVYEDGTFTHYANGEQIDTGAHGFNTQGDKLVVGEELNGGENVAMDVSAVVIYDRALSDQERREVETYLRQKYVGDTSAEENRAPETAADDVTVAAGESIDVSVLANDEDPDGELDPSSVTIVDQPQAGTATANADGTVTYEHDGSEATSDSFTYTVSDRDGATSDVQTVSVTVEQPETANPSDGTPETADDEVEITAGETVTHDVLANDPAQNLDPATLEIVSGDADFGTATANANGTITYQHDGSATGRDVVEYRVEDENGNTSNATQFTVLSSEGTGPAPGDDSGSGDDGGDTNTGGNDDGTNTGGNDGGTNTGGNDDDTNTGGNDDDTNTGGNDGGDDNQQPSQPSSPSSGSGGSGSVPPAEDDDKASFELSNATLSTRNVTVGEPVDVSATVGNVGDADGETTMNLTVGNSTVDSRELALEANANTTVSFTYAFERAGTYELSVGNQSLGTVTVQETAQSENTTDGDGQSAGTETEDAESGDGVSDGDEAETTTTDAPTGATTATEDVTETETASATESGETTGTSTNTPGFGALVTLLSLSLAAAMLARRRID
ncbi:PQQ-dependent sugar dehydrogenase [Halogeometricum limi]|uniref:PGF-CTERM protein n=1 Tax=Halogeometricum limi TaxID=555875 RepID=A0A1I6INQ2_9EURY|nr:PQQ-dependent sugar dehydrogenase [Halogeometricum limi]SFR67880.1 PGF-CTERM protein [Halogeometricum limi]